MIEHVPCVVCSGVVEQHSREINSAYRNRRTCSDVCARKLMGSFFYRQSADSENWFRQKKPWPVGMWFGKEKDRP